MVRRLVPWVALVVREQRLARRARRLARQMVKALPAPSVAERFLPLSREATPPLAVTTLRTDGAYTFPEAAKPATSLPTLGNEKFRTIASSWLENNQDRRFRSAQWFVDYHYQKRKHAAIGIRLLIEADHHYVITQKSAQNESCHFSLTLFFHIYTYILMFIAMNM